MKTAEWTLDAQADLASIDQFYFDLSPDFADRVGDAALAAAVFFHERPHAGAPLGFGSLRKWRVRATPHLLIYRLVPAGIQIVRVRHVREDWRPVE